MNCKIDNSKRIIDMEYKKKNIPAFISGGVFMGISLMSGQ